MSLGDSIPVKAIERSFQLHQLQGVKVEEDPLTRYSKRLHNVAYPIAISERQNRSETLQCNLCIAYKLPLRAQSRSITAKGIFEGAIVVRGIDWAHGDTYVGDSYNPEDRGTVLAIDSSHRGSAECAKQRTHHQNHHLPSTSTTLVRVQVQMTNRSRFFSPIMTKT
ncbi:unnamed protein product [Allacma fusca]|uniref:Uncharacterized protein n=1 Tax=Allacma fusca TaxID=39272 RepID=A0A8J2JU93_9HEXA|nr:unnamed protein product [Allacma fusca]